jgi:hypothetical protein
MSDVQVRPFRRGDRDRLTHLVNAHAEAVVPGMSVSVNTVLGSLERQPGEFIEDPWVSERVTLVAEQRSRVAAAAHLLRYFPDERAGESARGAGDPAGQSYDDYRAFLPAVGFRELTRTARGWTRERLTAGPVNATAGTRTAHDHDRGQKWPLWSQNCPRS